MDSYYIVENKNYQCQTCKLKTEKKYDFALDSVTGKIYCHRCWVDFINQWVENYGCRYPNGPVYHYNYYAMVQK